MMSNKSFSAVCDDWRRNNPEYNNEWSYDLGETTFVVSVAPAKETTKEDTGRYILSKATLPNSPDLNVPIVNLVLELLRTQVELYEKYGIKV